MITRLLSVLVLLAGAAIAPAMSPAAAADANERQQIDNAANQVLPQLYRSVKGSEQLAAKAQGMLVFPNVYAAGVGIGGQYGKGELRIGGKPAAYYSITSASVGLQLGAQSTNIVFLFMTPQALDSFRKSSGWQAGASAGVTVVNTGAGGSVDTSRLNAPVLAFVFGNTGLMANASVEGTKISKLDL